MRFPTNPYEHEDEPTDPLPRDAHGKTVVPSASLLSSQIAQLQRAVNEERRLEMEAAQRRKAEAQWWDRFWVQR